MSGGSGNSFSIALNRADFTTAAPCRRRDQRRGPRIFGAGSGCRKRYGESAHGCRPGSSRGRYRGSECHQRRRSPCGGQRAHRHGRHRLECLGRAPAPSPTGSLSVRIRTRFDVSQPAPLSPNGEMVVTPNSRVSAATRAVAFSRCERDGRGCGQGAEQPGCYPAGPDSDLAGAQIVRRAESRIGNSVTTTPQAAEDK